MSKNEGEQNNRKKLLLGVIAVVAVLILGVYLAVSLFSGGQQDDPTTTNSYELETVETTAPVKEADADTSALPASSMTPESPARTTEPVIEFETPFAPTINTDEPTAEFETPSAPVVTTPEQTDPPETITTTDGQTDPPETPAQTDPPETTEGRTNLAPTTTRASETTRVPSTTEAPTTTAPRTTEAPTTAEPYVVESGTYTDKDHVAAYLEAFGHLPSNYVTKSYAESCGWSGSGSDSLWKYSGLNGKSIGGSYFGNYEGILPKKSGRKYYECDIDYNGKSRGTKRIVYSSDGLIFYTEDHYNTFKQFKNGSWVSYN